MPLVPARPWEGLCRRPLPRLVSVICVPLSLLVLRAGGLPTLLIFLREATSGFVGFSALCFYSQLLGFGPLSCPLVTPSAECGLQLSDARVLD